MPALATELNLQSTNKLITNIKIPTYQKKFDKQIFSVQFSPYDWSQNILCIAFADKICVAQVKFEDGFEYEVIGEFSQLVECHCVVLSPQTSLNVLPKILQFCTTGDDFKLRLYKSDLLDTNTCQILNGHTSYVNEINFETENNYLASVSDDQTARVWDTNDCSCFSIFYLSSPGVSVCWHKEDSAKLMVAEKNGLVRFYNIHSQQPILSLDNNAPISFAHWSPSDSQLIGAMHRGELILWDVTRPSLPTHVKAIHVDGNTHIQFSPQGNYVASVNSFASGLKVTQLENGQTKLDCSVLLPTNVTWHFRLPIVCVGDDRTLCFLKV